MAIVRITETNGHTVKRITSANISEEIYETLVKFCSRNQLSQSTVIEAALIKLFGIKQVDKYSLVMKLLKK